MADAVVQVIAGTGAYLLFVSTAQHAHGTCDGVPVVKAVRAYDATVGTTAYLSFAALAYRPGSCTLYGISNTTGQLYTINPATGASTPITTGAIFLPAGADAATVYGSGVLASFDPTTGQLTVLLSTDPSFLYNVSVNPDTGVATLGTNVTLPGSTTIANTLGAIAYTNQVANATASALYALGAATDTGALTLYVANGATLGAGAAINSPLRALPAALGLDVRTGVNACTGVATNEAVAFLVDPTTNIATLAHVGLTDGSVCPIGRLPRFINFSPCSPCPTAPTPVSYDGVFALIPCQCVTATNAQLGVNAFI